MCGIIGYIGSKDAVPVLVEGLRRLEYRGYDSAGIALIKAGTVEIRRSAGKLSQLEKPSAHSRSKVITAWDILDGPRTAARQKKTHILIVIAPAKLLSSTTESSRIILS